VTARASPESGSEPTAALGTTADLYDLAGLSAGAHDITVWIRQVGTGNCVLQAGGYAASLYVDELN